MTNRLPDKTFMKQNDPIQNNQWEATVFLSDDANVFFKKVHKSSSIAGTVWDKRKHYIKLEM